MAKIGTVRTQLTDDIVKEQTSIYKNFQIDFFNLFKLGCAIDLKITEDKISKKFRLIGMNESYILCQNKNYRTTFSLANLYCGDVKFEVLEGGG